jgi:regulator of protease activity HflC (stomatin/prohibitin superfamily)
MAWVAVTIILVMIIVGLAIARQVVPDQRARFGFLVGQGFCVFLIAAFTLFECVTQINVGHVGVVKSFGQISGTLGPGVQFKAPWQTVDDFTTQVQSQPFDNITSFSRETQATSIDLTLNYSINPKDVTTLARNVGTGWFDKLVPNRLFQAVKDETVKYNAVDIAPNREPLRKAIIERLQSSLDPYSITVNDVNLTNISFSKQFEAAIEAKQQATQQALQAQQQIATADFRAQARIKAAEGDATATIAAAKGQAEANRLLAASLTQPVLTQRLIDKLAPGVKVLTLPSTGAGNLFDLSTLVK